MPKPIVAITSWNPGNLRVRVTVNGVTRDLVPVGIAVIARAAHRQEVIPLVMGLEDLVSDAPTIAGVEDVEWDIVDGRP